MAKFNQDGGGGAGAAPTAPAPAAAPAPAPAATPAPAAPAAAPSSAPAGTPPASGTPPAQAAPAAAAPAAPAGKLIDSLPERGSPEYWAKFGELSFEQRIQVENEWTARDAGLDKAPEKKPEADPAAAPLPGDAPKAEEDVFMTPEDLAKMDPRVRAVVETMQKAIDEAAPMMDENFGKGLQIYMEDPIIAQRMQEIASGEKWNPGALAKTFDAKTYLTPETIEAMPDPVTHPEEFAAKMAETLQKAHEDGLRQGQQAKEYEMGQKVELAERKSFFETGFKGLTDAHPELKSNDPAITDIRDPNHPMKPFVVWASKNLGDRYFINPENKMPFESAYAAYLASTGTLNKTIAKVATESRFKFIRNLQAAQTHAATVGRDTPSAAPPAASPVPGLDVERYRSDPAYRSSFFQNADYATRLKLEQVSYGNLK